MRNDLYLTLSHGEFTKGTKSSDRNIEVSVKVLNEKGQVIKVLFAYHFLKFTPVIKLVIL